MAKANKTVAKDLIERVAVLERKLQKVGRIQVGGNPFQGTVVNVIDLPDAPDIDTDIYYVSETNSFYYWNTVTETWEVIGGGGGSGGGHIIADETVTLPARARLDFVGPGVTAFDHAGGLRTVVNVPGVSAQRIIRAAVLVEGATAVVQYDNDSIAAAGAPDHMTFNHGGAYVGGIYVLQESADAGAVALRLLLNGVVLGEAADEVGAGDKLALSVPGGFIAGVGDTLSWEADGIDPDRVRFWVMGHPDATTTTALGRAMVQGGVFGGTFYNRQWPMTEDVLDEAFFTERFAGGGAFDDTSLGGGQPTWRLGADDSVEAIKWFQPFPDAFGMPDLDGTVTRPYTQMNLQVGAEAMPGGPGEGPEPGGPTLVTERGYYLIDDLDRRWEFGWTEEYSSDISEMGHKTYTGYISLDGAVLVTGPTYFSDGGASMPIRLAYDPYGIVYGEPTIHLLHSDLTRLELPADSWQDMVGHAFKGGMFNRGDYPWYIQDENAYVATGDRHLAFDSDPTLQTWIDTYAVLDSGHQADAASDTIDLSIGTDNMARLKLVRSGVEGGLTPRYVGLPVSTGGIDWTVDWDLVNTDLGEDALINGERVGVWVRSPLTGGLLLMGTWWDATQLEDEERRLFIDFVDGPSYAESGQPWQSPPFLVKPGVGNTEIATGFTFDPTHLDDDNLYDPIITVESAAGSLSANLDVLTAIKAVWGKRTVYEWGLFYMSGDSLHKARLERWQGDVRRFGPSWVPAWLGGVTYTAEPLVPVPIQGLNRAILTSSGAEPDHHGPPDMDPPGYSGFVKINQAGLYTVTITMVFDAKGSVDELPTADLDTLTGAVQPTIPATYNEGPFGDVEYPVDPQPFSVLEAGNEVVESFDVALAAGDLVGYDVRFDGEEGGFVFLAGISLKVEPAA